MKSPLDLVWRLAAIAGVLGLGFVLGRMSGGVDDQDLRDSLAVYREHRTTDKAENARMRNDLKDEHERRVRSEAVTLSLTESAARLVSGASRTMVTANETKRRADSMFASLRNARTLKDTNDVLVAACTERGNECALVRRANDSLFRATADLKKADSSSQQTIASFRRDSVTLTNRVARDSSRLDEADGLIVQLQKAARGCRVPLVGIPCPMGTVNLDFDGTNRTLSIGAGMPLKLWDALPRINLSVTTPIYRKGKP